MDIFGDLYNWVFLVNILIVVEEKAQLIKSCLLFNHFTSSSKKWLIVTNKNWYYWIGFAPQMIDYRNGVRDKIDFLYINSSSCTAIYVSVFYLSKDFNITKFRRKEWYDVSNVVLIHTCAKLLIIIGFDLQRLASLSFIIRI